MIFRCDEQELVDSGTLNQLEVDWYNDNRAISYFADGSVWRKKALIEAKVEEAIEQGKVKQEPVVHETFTPSTKFYVNSDCIDAFISQADGKHYDSKAKYRQSLKEQGLIEVGNDYKQMLEPKKHQQDNRETKKAIYDAIQQHGGLKL